MNNKKETECVDYKLLFNQVVDQRNSCRLQLKEKTEENQRLNDSITRIANSLKEKERTAEAKDLEISRLKQKVNQILRNSEKLREGAINWEKTKLLSLGGDRLKKPGSYEFYFQKPLEEIKKFADAWKEEDEIIESNQRKNQVQADTSDKIVAIED